MSVDPHRGKPNVFPGMMYRDAPAAMDWLVRVFGFTQRFTVPNPDGSIAHAELGFGPGVIMLGSAKGNPFGMKLPSEAGGVTQAVYCYLPDPDALFERVQAAGAEILRGISDTDYGSREFSVRDPEGHVWHFGSYHPDAPA